MIKIEEFLLHYNLNIVFAFAEWHDVAVNRFTVNYEALDALLAAIWIGDVNVEFGTTDLSRSGRAVFVPYTFRFTWYESGLLEYFKRHVKRVDFAADAGTRRANSDI